MANVGLIYVPLSHISHWASHYFSARECKEGSHLNYPCCDINTRKKIKKHIFQSSILSQSEPFFCMFPKEKVLMN